MSIADFLIRDLNEWDDFSLEEAVKIKEASAEPVEVVAVSVGPEEADEALRKCLAKGADRAVRVWDEAVEGSDSDRDRAHLAAVAKREAPDMLFAGVQSSDQSFASTGIATAAFLGWPHAAVVSSLATRRERRRAVFRRELEGGLLHEVEIQCPAVLTIQLGINTPRYASLRSIKQAAAKPIEVKSLADLGLTRRRRRSRLALARAAHVHSGQGPRAAHRGRRRSSRPRASLRSSANSRETRHERHTGHCRTAARRTAPRVARTDRRGASAASAPATKWPSRCSARRPDRFVGAA